VSWPPHGAFPLEIVPEVTFLQWSFATFEPQAGAFNTFNVSINGVAATATQFEPLWCA
jgi:hypothetical protein